MKGERKIIKNWVDKAKNRNNNDNGKGFWKVRGTPSLSMHLVKIIAHKTLSKKRMGRNVT